jgi:hypothetical protein
LWIAWHNLFLLTGGAVWLIPRASRRLELARRIGTNLFVPDRNQRVPEWNGNIFGENLNVPAANACVPVWNFNVPARNASVPVRNSGNSG